MSLSRILAIIACLSISACMVGPDYKEPIVPVARHWSQKNASVKEKPFTDARWWEVFHDPALSDLVNQGYLTNISLQSAGVKVLQARAQLAQSVGQLYPQQQALIGNYTFNRIGGGSLQGLLPQTFDTALLGFTASWEVDFWGKYRRAIQSNNAAFLASAAAYDNALITLIGDIASTYIKIRRTQAQIRTTQANIRVQAEGVRIATSRFKAGQTSEVDVEQAKTELAETEARMPTLAADLQHQKDYLAVLLGAAPNGADTFLKKSLGIPKAPTTIAVGIPCESLLRRPDIYQAREEAIAQSAAIGVAKANLYPSFSLSGTFAFAANTIGSSSISNLFNWSNRTATAGPSINWPLLNYGQITNSVRVQDAVFQQSVLNYANLVLKAQQEVQDNITSYIEAKKAEQLLSRANTSATKALRLALIRYREGETDFTPVLNAEQQQLRVQTSWINAQGDIPLAVVALYRALGGGWQIRANNDLVAKQIKDAMAARTNWGGLLTQQNHMPPVTTGQKIQQLYLPTW